MGFRVNKRIKIAKGLSLNVGKKGISVSAKIGNTTINSRGRMTTRIAPGISYSTNLAEGNRNKRPSISSNTNVVNNEIRRNSGLEKDKKKAIILCCLGFVGISGIHKFYEGKIGMGILYLLTFGLFFIGTVVDLIVLMGKPSTYYV